MDHIVFQQSASSGARSVHCPGWSALVWYYRDVIKARDTSWSMDGDAAHLLIEKALTDNTTRRPKPAKKKIAEAIQRLKQDDEKERHFAAIQFAVHELKKQIKKRGGEWQTEEYLQIFPEFAFGGHVDFRQITKKTLYINDYKHGAGVGVDVVNNYQTVGYAHGALLKLPEDQRKKIKKVVTTIIQPRCTAVKPVQVQTYTRDELTAHVRMLRAGVGNAHGVFIQSQTSKTKPAKKHLFRGDHCQFCPAKTHCPRWSDKAKKVVKTYRKTTDGNPDAYPDLSQKKLEQLLLDAQGIVGYLKRVEEFVVSQIASKEGAGLVKTIPGNSRTYVDPTARNLLDKALKKKRITKEQYDQCFKTGYNTLAVLQQTLPPKLYAKLTRQTRNKPQLVSVDDKRKSTVEVYKGKFNG